MLDEEPAGARPRARASLAFRGVLLTALAASPIEADEPKKAVAGEQYAAGGSHRFFWGADYRDLWTTAATFDVLNLAEEAGGLTPVRRVGGQQTKGLALRGEDGRSYTFRGLEKDAGDILWEDLRGTIVETLLNDQMAAQHPGSEVVARVLLEAGGVPVPTWRLVTLPDDPRLGEFQKDFAGAIGVFAEYPSAQTDTHPGYLGATEIIDHLALYERLARSPAERVDVAAFLRARLMDVFMGDWDRHRKQWRWARTPKSPYWIPIPEDRDQAFSRYEGFLVGLGRGRDPRFQAFSPEYAAIRGLVNNGREQDRQLLAEVPRETFAEIAKDLAARLGDDVIDRAARMLPPEWYAVDGPRLAAALRARRDALPRIADAYYLHLAHRPDVTLTDQGEAITATRQANGDLEVVATSREGALPVFRRVFHRNETQEVRLYTGAGDDTLTVKGGEGPIKLRMVGGRGQDVLDDREGGGTRLSDEAGQNRVLAGPGTHDDARPYSPPPPPKTAPWVPPLDYGKDLWLVPWVSWGSDLGVFLGGGFERRTYGFRKHPFAASHTVRAGWGFGAETGRAEYLGVFPRENSRSFLGVVAYASGIETLRYYGLGNDSLAATRIDDDFYKAKEAQYLLYASYNWKLNDRTVLSLGPAARFSENARDQVTFIQLDQPYGFGSFGQAGAQVAFLLDSRDNRQYPRRGVRASARTNVWPEGWDLEETFGTVSGDLTSFVSAGPATLGVRLGGERVFGRYPFRDAAYLGGGGLSRGALLAPEFTLRGYRANRFGGDGSLFANTDLRLQLGRLEVLIPFHVGVFGLFDVGRVFLQGEDSDTWHTSVGGGVWVSLLNFRNTFTAYVGHSKEDTVFRVGGGFSF